MARSTMFYPFFREEKPLKNKTGNPKSSGALFPFMRAQHPAEFLFLNVLLRDVTL